jgi:hypothetical protein
MAVERSEKRVLIAYAEFKDGILTPAERRKRGMVIDGVLGITDDGYVIHIPTGRNVCPPDGREVVDDRAYVDHLLTVEPDGWAASKRYKFGEPLRPSLRERLVAARDSYTGN